MVFGMSLATYTLIHVIISLIGIISGLIVLFGMIGNKRLGGLTAIFLIATVLTSVTGYGFPVEHLMPSHIVGAISLAALLFAILARYLFHMAGNWRAVYVITSAVALYLNCFVLVTQTFEKVFGPKPVPHPAPPPAGPAFAFTQGIVLALFTVWGYLAVRNFHPETK